MKAMLFAAGLGTRLLDHTKDQPKALVKVNGKTMLEHAIDYLYKNGCDHIIINTHHYSELIKEFISAHTWPVKISISDESNEVLETGGGLMKAAHYFEGEKFFIAYNVDVLCDLKLQDLINYHLQSKALASLCVRKRNTKRYLLFNESLELSGWINKANGDQIIRRNCEHYLEYAFSGIQILQTEIFKHIHETGKFSIIKSYLDLAKDFKIAAYDHSDTYWLDMGKPDSLKEASQYLNQS